MTIAAVTELAEDHPLGRVRVPLTVFNRLSEEDQFRLLADRYDGPERGVDRFATLLEMIDAKPNITAETRHHLRELQQVRNVILHRGGIADQRLCNVARTFEPERGVAIRLDEDQLGAYAQAINNFEFETVTATLRLAGAESEEQEADP